MGAALASPITMVLVSRTFPDGPRRHRAMVVYAAMPGAGGLLGVLLSGPLIDIGSWRWVMLVNVPVAVALLVGAPLALPVDRGRKGRFEPRRVQKAHVGLLSTCGADSQPSDHRCAKGDDETDTDAKRHGDDREDRSCPGGERPVSRPGRGELAESGHR